MSTVIIGNINSLKTTIAYRNKKIVHPNPESVIYKFHYRTTTIALFCASLLVTSTEWIAGIDVDLNLVPSYKY